MSAATRAARIAGPRQIALAQVTPAEPAAGQVRIRLEGCGVCASNLPVWEGRPWFGYPLAPGAPGHEGWGRIDAIGPGVQGFAPGERVTFLSGNAYADYDCADASTLVRLPPALAGRPFPGEPLGCAMNIFRRSGIEPGHTVAVVGTGFLGVVLTALATRAGAQVIALSHRPFGLGLALEQGARAALSLDDPSAALREAQRLAGPRGCERVIEAAGTQAALDLASSLCGTRARLVIAGYHQDGHRSVDLQSWNWRGLDVVNAHERDPAEYRRGMQEAVDLVAGGGFDPAPLLTHRFPLEDAQIAFQTLSTRPQGFLKAFIECA